MCEVGSGRRQDKKSKRSIKQAARGVETVARGLRLDAQRRASGVLGSVVAPSGWSGARSVSSPRIEGEWRQ